jgi:hypothetical protein
VEITKYGFCNLQFQADWKIQIQIWSSAGTPASAFHAHSNAPKPVCQPLWPHLHAYAARHMPMTCCHRITRWPPTGRTSASSPRNRLIAPSIKGSEAGTVFPFRHFFLCPEAKTEPSSPPQNLPGELPLHHTFGRLLPVKGLPRSRASHGPGTEARHSPLRAPDGILLPPQHRSGEPFSPSTSPPCPISKRCLALMQLSYSCRTPPSCHQLSRTR